MKFTQKQGQYLAYIDLYTRLNRRPPAEADIQAYFHTTAPAALVRLAYRKHDADDTFPSSHWSTHQWMEP